MYTVTQEEVVANNHREFLERQRRREEELQAETVSTEWCYGPQKLNYVELKKVRDKDARCARSRRAVDAHVRGEAMYLTMPPERYVAIVRLCVVYVCRSLGSDREKKLCTDVEVPSV